MLVQLSSITSLELRLLDMQALITACGNDSHLATSLSSLAMQVLYVCSGCDFISFFNGLEKVIFYQHFMNIVDSYAAIAIKPKEC